MSILVGGSWVKLSIFLNWYSQMSNWITIGFHKKSTSFTLLKVISHFRRNSHSPSVFFFVFASKYSKPLTSFDSFVLSLPLHRQTNWKKILRFHLPHKIGNVLRMIPEIPCKGKYLSLYLYPWTIFFFNSKNECKAIFLVVYRLFKYMFIYRV